MDNVFAFLKEKDAIIMLDEAHECENENVIHNGSKIFIKVNRKELNNYNYQAIVINANNFNLNAFLKRFDVVIYSRYIINDYWVYDGYSKILSNYFGGKIQIATSNNGTIIGMPAICTSF